MIPARCCRNGFGDAEERVVSVLVIAEAGVNHNGSEQLALRAGGCRGEARADVVKFQTFDPKRLVSSACAEGRISDAQ